MSINFNRRLLVAFIVALIAAWIFYVSYFQENPDPYLFPSILGVLILSLSLISLTREAFDWCVDDFKAFPFIRQIPVILMLVGAVYLIEVIGMYSTAFVTLLTVSIWYSPEPDKMRRFVRSLLFSVGFCGFMYLLFSLMLNVQLPRGMLI